MLSEDSAAYAFSLGQRRRASARDLEALESVRRPAFLKHGASILFRFGVDAAQEANPLSTRNRSLASRSRKPSMAMSSKRADSVALARYMSVA